ncbi:hypothetical protein GPL15_23340 [Clostridium sp. MCC353]|uniref:hypothetical protein n=1 Tax=Clostridium sp. MCC353 TaxID=2592646 RepID=UPI001C016A88|nr:hypothetical protein [Clostridium sp. MCC353]MBT9779416.1 hypothetical protein [Clostridium sp. MCC353]
MRQREPIKYSDLREYLLGKGLNEWEAMHSIGKLRKIDPDLKKAFYECFNEGVEPDITISNITYQELVTKLNMNMVQAFLYLDWLRREPEIALDTMDRTTPMNLDESFMEKTSQITFEGEEKEEEDESDLTITSE